MQISFKKILIASIAPLLFASCGGGSNDSVKFTDAEKQFVKNLFLTEYLWAAEVDASIDHHIFSTPESLVRALRVNPPDKWSFTMSRKSYEDYSSQKTSGFGIGYQADFRIYVVLIDSPAYGKLQRGDIIQKINGEEASETRIRAASTALGTPALFTVLRDTQTLDITVTPKEYTHKVAYSKVIPYAGKKVGYLRYDAFTDASVREIENAFTLLHAEEIDELVIDLRYNGGGSVETAKILLDNITNAYPEQRQIYLDWNPDYHSHNFYQYCMDPQYYQLQN